MSSEIYRKESSINIPGRSLGSIDGVKVPTDHPFKAGHIPAFSEVSINPKAELSLWGKVKKDRLIKVSPIHGRSYELRFGETKNVFWEDKYGNLYSTITTKGNNLMFPSIQEAGNLPHGIFTHGLQDASLVARPLQASEILRASGIETEMIVKVIEPLELPYHDSLVPISNSKKEIDFKRGLIWLFCMGNGNRDSTPPSDERIKNIEERLNDMKFLITVRGLQVSERMEDFMKCETGEEFVRMMKRVFTFVNMAEQTKSKRDSSYKAVYFDAAMDIDKYMVQYLPRKLGANLAKLHNLDLVHKYPHAGNISAAGGLYDLDSIWGKSLGDKPVKVINKAQDIDFLIDGTSNSIGIGTVLTDLVRKNFIPSIGGEFFANFVEEYSRTAVDSSPIDEAESLEFLRILKKAS